MVQKFYFRPLGTMMRKSEPAFQGQGLTALKTSFAARTLGDVDGGGEPLLARAARQRVVVPLVLLACIHVVVDLRRGAHVNVRL